MIGLRPGHRQEMLSVDRVEVLDGLGLEGDHATSRRFDPDGKRHVTLIQEEHLPVIAALSGLDEVTPALLRRNLVVRGINLTALKDRKFTIGEATFEGTGFCHPCSRMEWALGEGGYNAMRGHGGLNARVVVAGWIRVGDRVSILLDERD